MSDPSDRDVPLAIVGIGAVFPGARDAAAYWANVADGVDAITDLPETHFRADDYVDEDHRENDGLYTTRGGFLEPLDFDPLAHGVTPHDLEAVDTAQLLGLVVARRALDDAGYGEDGRAFDRERVSVLLGVTGALELVVSLGSRLGHPHWRRALRDAGVDAETAEDVVARIGDAYPEWREQSFPGLLGNVVAGRIANRLDLHGTNTVVDAACASSLSALHLASLELQTGRADMVVTGGVDTFNDVFMYKCFTATPALSPSGDARPFAADADGTILGEGLGICVVKRLADAERDGDRIYAVIRGVGTSSDGKGNAVFAPSAEGQKRALRDAYQRAGVSPATVELVEAHGTGTRVGDAVEASALADVYRDAREDGVWCALGSVKSQIGHTKAAAGMAGLIKTVLALHHKVLPPTIKVDRPSDAFGGDSPLYVNIEKRPWIGSPDHPRRAAVSAFGFGGSNFHCVLEEASPQAESIDWDTAVEMIPVGAETPAGVSDGLAAWADERSWDAVRRDAAAARKAFARDARCRLVLVVERDRTDLPRLVEHALAQLAKPGAGAQWSTPDGAYFGSGAAPGELAFLFPGQGSQSVGMLRDLACRFPSFHEVLGEAERVFALNDPAARRLTDLVYPFPAFDDEAREDQRRTLTDTRVAQPAIGAVSLGAATVLARFGVHPDAVAGHSYGELVALCSAGRFSSVDLHALSAVRGRLMTEGEGELGAMVAVQAEEDAIRTAVAEASLDLVLANRNAPRQLVLSGRTQEVERAVTVFAERGVRAKRLRVAAAFHSPLVSHAQEPMGQALLDVEFRAGDVPVYANTTAERYPASDDEARALLAGQLAHPVEFVTQVTNLHRDGVRTFVEVGPSARLSGLVDAILDGQDHCVIPVDASSGRRRGAFDLAVALARIAVLGHRVDLTRWNDGSAPPEAASGRRFTVPVCGANHRHETPPRPPRPQPPPAPTSGTEPQPLSIPQPPTQALEALRAAQAHMAALQQLQAQTAELHRKFLEGQEQAHRTLQALLGHQQPQSLGAVPTMPQMPAPVIPAMPVAPAPVPTPVPVAPVAVPAAPPAAVVAPSAVDTGLADVLLAVIAEKTGYPVEMLELDMELDADLGIDSIKRVEILSAVQERAPGAREVPADMMGQLRTLREVVEFVGAGAPAATAIPAAPSDSGLADVLLAVIAEKTGYPVEMLELDMELDADLGIDSIKRVEILSAVQERAPGAREVPADMMGQLRTLREVVEFVSAGATAPVANAAQADSGAAADTLLGVVAEKTGYPVEMLELDMELDADLGIDSIKRVEILSAVQERIPGAREVPADAVGRLRTLRDVVTFLTEATPVAAPGLPPAAPVPVARPSRLVRRVLELEPVAASRAPLTLDPSAPVWVVGDGEALGAALAAAMVTRGVRAEVHPMDDPMPARLGGLVVLTPPDGGDDAFLGATLGLLQRSAAPLAAVDGALFATVSRLDGGFGLVDLNGTGEPLSAGLTGFAKTASHEWDGVTCRAVDLRLGFPSHAAAAEALADELLLDGPLEVGLAPDGCVTLTLREKALNGGPREAPLSTGDLVLVTGGARGVTAEVVVAMAGAFGATFLLLGRSPEPEAEPAWLAGISGEADVKRALLARLNGNGTPKALEAEYRNVVRAREIQRNLERILAAGGKAVYRAVDVRDVDAVRTVVDAVRREHGGPVRGVLHGAGVLADARIEDKTPEQFERVYGTKVDGLRAVLGAVGDDDLALLVLFSSSTGRFGRAGQADYAAANEVLNKVAQREARGRPGCRVVSVNWGPWDGGMVTPGLARLFEGEGIGLIGLDEGARYLVDEVSVAGAGPVEVVVLADAGGAPLRAAPQTDLPRAFTRTVDVASHPVLADHVIGGSAVLPVALMVEWLAHGAIHGNPGLRFAGLSDLRVLAGVKVAPGGSVDVSVHAGAAQRRGTRWVVPVELRTERLNVRATVELGTELDRAEPLLAGVATQPFSIPQEALYDVLFHGPALHGITAIEGASDRGIAAASRAAPSPSAWFAHPLRGSWLTDPLALDAAFQLMVVWTREHASGASLPSGLGRLRLFRSSFPRDGVRIVVQVNEVGPAVARADMEFLAADGSLVARIDGYECVIDRSLEDAFAQRSL